MDNRPPCQCTKFLRKESAQANSWRAVRKYLCHIPSPVSSVVSWILEPRIFSCRGVHSISYGTCRCGPAPARPSESHILQRKSVSFTPDLGEPIVYSQIYLPCHKPHMFSHPRQLSLEE